VDGEGEEEEYEGLNFDLGIEDEVGINKPGMSSSEKSPSLERSTFLSGGITNSVSSLKYFRMRSIETVSRLV